MKKVFGGVGILLLIILAGFAVALALGYAYIGAKVPQQKVVLLGEVCNQKVIDQFNNSYTDGVNDQMARTYNDIVAQEAYKKDATCQYIVTKYHIVNLDKPAAEASLREFKVLIANSNYPNPTVTSSVFMYDLETSVRMIGDPQQLPSGNGAG